MRKSNICGIPGFMALRTLVGITIMIILLVGGVEANGYNISNCTYIHSPGEYILTQDIITDSSSCINIYSNDVIFDGAGHTIYGIGSGYTRGVALPGVNGSGSVQRVTVKNLTVTGWYNGISLMSPMVGSSNITLNNNNVSNNDYGIYLSNSNYNNLSGNNASNNDYGIHLSNSNYNNLSGNNASNNNYGIYLDESNSNIIYNNYFYNLFNAYDTSFFGNYWNTTKQAGTNIIGGPYLGGNYWSDYAGNDTDGDGLGNIFIPYNSSGNIINGGDYLPLTEEKVTQAVSPGGTVTTDPEGTGPTVSDPVETYVTTPTGGTVTIEETPATEPPPAGFYIIGQQVTITAPDAESIDNPLSIVFKINSTQIPDGESDLNDIIVTKDGVKVENQKESAPSGRADPDPCISKREVLSNGDGGITVLTTSACVFVLYSLSVEHIIELIQNLINDVEDLNLQQGIDNSLDAKLDTTMQALEDINTNNDVAAVNSLDAFINAVNAQRGKQISDTDADALIADAQEIIALLTGT